MSFRKACSIAAKLRRVPGPFTPSAPTARTARDARDRQVAHIHKNCFSIHNYSLFRFQAAATLHSTEMLEIRPRREDDYPAIAFLLFCKTVSPGINSPHQLSWETKQ